MHQPPFSTTVQRPCHAQPQCFPGQVMYLQCQHKQHMSEIRFCQMSHPAMTMQHSMTRRMSQFPMILRYSLSVQSHTTHYHNQIIITSKAHGPATRLPRLIQFRSLHPPKLLRLHQWVFDLDAWLLDLGVVNVSKKQALPEGLNRHGDSGTTHRPPCMRIILDKRSEEAISRAQTACGNRFYTIDMACKPPPGLPCASWSLISRMNHEP